jgi:hypothetical protein
MDKVTKLITYPVSLLYGIYNSKPLIIYESASHTPVIDKNKIIALIEKNQDISISSNLGSQSESESSDSSDGTVISEYTNVNKEVTSFPSTSDDSPGPDSQHPITLPPLPLPSLENSMYKTISSSSSLLHHSIKKNKTKQIHKNKYYLIPIDKVQQNKKEQLCLPVIFNTSFLISNACFFIWTMDIYTSEIDSTCFRM